MQGYNNGISLAVHITEKCNLRCPGCYTLNDPNAGVADGNLEFIQMAIEKIKPSNIVLYGGEAILNPNLIREIMLIYPKLKYAIHTNGSIYSDTIKDIYDRVDNFAITIDSFNEEWLRKNKGFTTSQFKNFEYLIQTYNEKMIITHNVFAKNNDAAFLKDLQKYGILTDWYLFITASRFQEFLKDFKTIEPNSYINTKPKLRLLVDGTITRDMRGVYNICHISDWDDKFYSYELPISDKCKSCEYFTKCHACNMFPHFVKDILDNVDYEPHFCKFTKFFWKGR